MEHTVAYEERVWEQAREGPSGARDQTQKGWSDVEGSVLGDSVGILIVQWSKV